VVTLVAQEEPEDALMTSESATTASHHRALFRVRKRARDVKKFRRLREEGKVKECRRWNVIFEYRM
jgi:hypothetical protein